MLVLDESPLFRRQLIVALERHPDVEVMAEAADSETAIRQTAELSPDVVFLTLRLPSLGGVRTALSLREIAPDLEIALIVGPDDDRELGRAVRAGVTGFVPWESATARCGNIARKLLQGHPVLTTEAARAVLAEYEREGRNAASSTGALGAPVLDGRERGVLERLAAGRSLPEAGADLDLTSAAAASLARNALMKLSGHARTQAVLHAASASTAADASRSTAG